MHGAAIVYTRLITIRIRVSDFLSSIALVWSDFEESSEAYDPLHKDMTDGVKVEPWSSKRECPVYVGPSASMRDDANDCRG